MYILYEVWSRRPLAKPQTQIPNKEWNLQKCWVLPPCTTDKKSVNREEKWAHTVWRRMVWDSLCSAPYSCCLVIDMTWIIPYRVTMFKAAILVQKQAALQMHADTTNISALLPLNTWSERLLAVLQVSWFFGASAQCSLFLSSHSFSIKNKYIYLIMGSPLIKSSPLSFCWRCQSVGWWETPG